MRPAYDLWQNERNKAQTLPSGCKVLREETPQGKIIVRMWSPKATKPFANYGFRTKEAADKYIYEQDEAATRHKESVAARKAARRGTQEQVDSVKVGDVFHHSWGWEQTNADFYQVIAREGRHVIVLQIAKTWADDKGISAMSANVVAVKDAFLKDAEPMKKLLQFSGGKPYITISEFGWCDLYNGRPVYSSWYA